MKLLKQIVLEGPDGSGKSALFTRLWTHGFPTGSHTGGPPTNEEEVLTRMRRLEFGERRVWDRCTAISDLIYRYALKEPFQVPPRVHVQWLIENRPCVVYCRPPIETILAKSLEQGKSHKPAAHLEKVERERTRIIEEYDKLMQWLQIDLLLTVVPYDYTKDGAAENLVSVLISSPFVESEGA